MSKNYQDYPPFDRIRIATGFGGGSGPSVPDRPAYVAPQILDLTLAQQAAICRDEDCAVPVRPGRDLI